MKSSELERPNSDVVGPPVSLPAAAFQAPAARISVTRGPDVGLSSRIDRPTFVVGTGATADLRLSDRAVSREHLQLWLVADGVHVRDLGSTNGAWTSALRLHDVIIVRSTEILIGSTTLSLSLERDLVDRADEQTGERMCPALRCSRCSAETPADEIERAAEALGHLPYHEARGFVLEHFQRAYLPAVLARAGNVVIRAAKLAGVRRGSFHRMLRRVRGSREMTGSSARTLHSSVSLDA